MCNHGIQWAALGLVDASFGRMTGHGHQWSALGSGHTAANETGTAGGSLQETTLGRGSSPGRVCRHGQDIATLASLRRRSAGDVSTGGKEGFQATGAGAFGTVAIFSGFGTDRRQFIVSKFIHVEWWHTPLNGM